MNPFVLHSDFQPTGDQPEAIKALTESLRANHPRQTLLGVTGSGKTFTLAKVIETLGRPTLVLSHNKTLAAQLYSEFKSFFPSNAVEYFISHYDYYQPEAYIPQTDTYIEKDASINEEIERLRLASTSALMNRRDVIVVASISCIYSLGSPEDMQELSIEFKVGAELPRAELFERLVQNLYERNEVDFKQGKFRTRAEAIDIFPAYTEKALRLNFFDETLESIHELDPLTGKIGSAMEHFHLYSASPYLAPQRKINTALKDIRAELKERIAFFEQQQRLVEAQRIKIRTQYDLELLSELGFCHGIENYSRHLSGRAAGERPCCLLDYLPKDSLICIDESHASIPQLRGMYRGDRARKERLIEHGFRLPSAFDNRPLKDEEFWSIAPQCIFVSATPTNFELESSAAIAEQLIRPTGLLDPEIEVRKAETQVEDLMHELKKEIEQGHRTLVTTLTKRMSEELTDYLHELRIKVEYLHSDIDALERVEILRRLRQGDFDVLVGVNLLREGLDLPEVALVAILDADKEGFLRSETSLIQTAGRAARHEKGRVIFYADRLNDTLKRVLKLSNERRAKQAAWNKAHNITPRGTKRSEQSSLQLAELSKKGTEGNSEKSRAFEIVIEEVKTEMLAAADAMQFEEAAVLRDQLEALERQLKESSKKGKTSRKSKASKKRIRKTPSRGKNASPKRKS